MTATKCQYGWGAEMLIKTQQKDGSWHHSYPGNVDTCFALLFLKRANVAKDLTSKIRQLGNLEELGGNP